MRNQETRYINENQAKQLLHELRNAQKRDQMPAENTSPPSRQAVRESGERASRAVSGLRVAYGEAPVQASVDRVGSASHGERGARRSAFSEQGQRLAEGYNNAIMDVARADEEIEALQAKQRRMAEYGDNYTDQAFVQRAKQIAQDLDSWTAWRAIRAKAVAEYSAKFTENNVQAEAARELDRIGERQAQLPKLRAEHQALFRKSEEYWEQLQMNEESFKALNERLVEAMARQAANTQQTVAPKAPKRGNLWSIFRRFRPDSGTEERRPEFGMQKPEPTEEVRGLLAKIAESNAKAEKIMEAKNVNDVRLHALDEQIREIEQLPLRKAA